MASSKGLTKSGGMTKEQRAQATSTARASRQRGRRAPGTSKDIATWGDVEGQMDLFGATI